MERLQILVNHHSEDSDVIGRFLSSLAMQTGVDFEVLILSDGGDGIPEEDLSGYPFPIRHAVVAHSGVCHTRNQLMDASDAPVLMFADIDDCFHADGLRTLMDAIVGADVACSPFLSELGDGSTRRHDRDTLHVHGKVFRASFLRDNSIRFPDEMEFGGDMAFLWLALAIGNVRWVEDCFYTWKWNPSSITRSLPHFHVRTYGTTLRCYTILGRDLIVRGRRDLLTNLVCTAFASIYIDVSSDAWHRYPDDIRRAAEECAVAFLREFWDTYERSDDAYRRSRYDLMVKFLGAGGRAGRFEDMRHKLGTMASDVLVIGNGVVGGNLSKELSALNPAVYDKYKGIDERVGGRSYKVAFVCVDTPRTDACACDTSEVEAAIRENGADVFVIKSTVLPGTTDRLIRATGKRIVFSPEYYGGTQHCDHARWDFDFTVLGGAKEDCIKVVQLLQGVYDGRHRFSMTDSKTAELAKYMENSWLATKVSFCNQFADIAEQAGVCYEELRELFLLDPRVSPAHTFVQRDSRGWDSHCLNKDVPAIAETYDAPLLEAVMGYNESLKSKFNV